MPSSQERLQREARRRNFVVHSCWAMLISLGASAAIFANRIESSRENRMQTLFIKKLQKNYRQRKLLRKVA